jgi:hypothetical protein
MLCPSLPCQAQQHSLESGISCDVDRRVTVKLGALTVEPMRPPPFGGPDVAQELDKARRQHEPARGRSALLGQPLEVPARHPGKPRLVRLRHARQSVSQGGDKPTSVVVPHSYVFIQSIPDDLADRLVADLHREAPGRFDPAIHMLRIDRRNLGIPGRRFQLTAKLGESYDMAP